MGRLLITTPVAEFTGVVAGVGFARGRAEIDSVKDSRALSYFQRRGYRVADLDAPAREPAVDENPDPPAPKRPGKSGSKADWVAYAVAQGVTADKADSLNRDQLADQIDALIAEAKTADETQNGEPQE